MQYCVQSQLTMPIGTIVMALNPRLPQPNFENIAALIRTNADSLATQVALWNNIPAIREGNEIIQYLQRIERVR